MKYKIYIFVPLFLLTCFFVFSESVSAKKEIVKTCIYGEARLGNFGYSDAKVDIYKDKKGYYVKNAVLNNVVIPDITGGFWNVGDLDSADPKDKGTETETIVNAKEKSVFKYVEVNGAEAEKKEHRVLTIDQFFKQYNDDESVECPSTLIFSVSDADNLQVLLLDDSLSSDGDNWGLNEIESVTSEYSTHNFLVSSGIYTTQAKNPDDSEEESQSEEDVELNTCEGLLGTIDTNTGEYAENTTGWLLQKIFDYGKLAVAAIIFGMTIKDYVLALTAQNDSKFKTANLNLVKRIIFALIFFLLPEIVNIVVGVVDSSTCGIK